MSTIEPVLGDTFLASKFNQTTPMTPVETVSPFPIATSTYPASTLGGTETIMRSSSSEVPPAPLMSSTSTSFPLQTEEIGLKQVLPSETLSTQPIVSEGLASTNVVAAPASTAIVNELPVITKELIQERPILEAVHERTFIERRTINNVQEIHEQPIIEIHEKPVIRTIQEAAEVKKFTAPQALREEINQPVAFNVPRPASIQRIKEAYVAQVNVAPVVREIIRREHVRVIEQPMVVEVRHKPIIEIYEQPILRIYHEKPIFRTIKVAAVTEGVAPVPVVPQQQVMAAPVPLQAPIQATIPVQAPIQAQAEAPLPLQSEATGQMVSSNTQILPASNFGAASQTAASSGTQYLPSATYASLPSSTQILPASTFGATSQTAASSGTQYLPSATYASLPSSSYTPSSSTLNNSSTMNTGPVLVPDAPVGTGLAGLSSGQVIGSSTQILPSSAAGTSVPLQQAAPAPLQSSLPPIFSQEQRWSPSGLPMSIANILKSSSGTAQPVATTSMPNTSVFRSSVV